MRFVTQEEFRTAYTIFSMMSRATPVSSSLYEQEVNNHLRINCKYAIALYYEQLRNIHESGVVHASDLLPPPIEDT